MLEIALGLIVFFAKAVIIVGAILIVFSFLASLAIKQKDSKNNFKISNLTKDIKETSQSLKLKMLGDKERKTLMKQNKKELKKESKSKNKSPKAKVFVLDFNGDIKASAAENLKKTITQIISLADPKTDEVLLRLESPGGMVSGYGLAASELSRLRNKNIKLTVAVDKVAASGGYLMSCVADKIVAAPFAIIGSIGVVAGMPNFNKLLKKHDIDYQVLTAGKFKRTLTMFGENTEEGKQKFVGQLEQIHTLFKNFVSKYRPSLNLEEVATGEYWFGEDALNLKLIDEIQTSEDLIMELNKKKELFHIEFKEKQKLTDKIMEAAKAKLFKPEQATDYL